MSLDGGSMFKGSKKSFRVISAGLNGDTPQSWVESASVKILHLTTEKKTNQADSNKIDELLKIMKEKTSDALNAFQEKVQTLLKNEKISTAEKLALQGLLDKISSVLTPVSEDTQPQALSITPTTTLSDSSEQNVTPPPVTDTHSIAPETKVDTSVDTSEVKIEPSLAPEGKVDAPEVKIEPSLTPEGKVDAPEVKIESSLTPEGKKKIKEQLEGVLSQRILPKSPPPSPVVEQNKNVTTTAEIHEAVLDRGKHMNPEDADSESFNESTEEAARKKVEEEATKEAANKKAAEEEAARKKAAEEEATKEAANKKAAEEEAAKKATEEAARKKAAEEEAARKKAAEEESTKKADEEAPKKSAKKEAEEAPRKTEKPKQSMPLWQIVLLVIIPPLGILYLLYRLYQWAKDYRAPAPKPNPNPQDTQAKERDNAGLLEQRPPILTALSKTNAQQQNVALEASNRASVPLNM